MLFRHQITSININGVAESATLDYDLEVLAIGRGSSCQIRLNARSVAIRHAELSAGRDGAPILRDLTDGAAVLKVNGRRVRERLLKSGDQLLVGTVSLQVFVDGGIWGVKETRRESEGGAEARDVTKDLRRIDLTRVLPRQTVLCLLAIAVIVAVFFADQANGKRLSLWSPGPMSDAHHLIGQSCETCHRVPFEPVRDIDCLRCHKLTDHAVAVPEIFKKHPDLNLRCAECHFEHRGGAKPVSNETSQCTSCHADIHKVKDVTGRPDVPSFNRHPEFQVSTVRFLKDDQMEVIRGLLGQGATDSTRLQFGHKKHLEERLRGLPAGKASLDCGDCHRLAPNRKEMLPVTFAGQCASCHPLLFDERLPGKQVPHGSSDLVYNTLYAEYSKLFLVTEQRNERMATVRRMKPGATVIDEPDLKFTRDFVEDESRNTEREIFTRSGCKVCHQITVTPQRKPGETTYHVLPPYLPVRWLPGARFDHGAHDNVRCVSCHSGAPQSEKTTDILLPGIQTCKGCHTSTKDHPVKLETSCIQCHSYHDPIGLSAAERRTVANFLLGR